MTQPAPAPAPPSSEEVAPDPAVPDAVSDVQAEVAPDIQAEVDPVVRAEADSYVQADAGAGAGAGADVGGGVEVDAEAVAPRPVPRPSPHHLAELSGTFAMTASVHDPEPAAPEPVREDDHHDDHHHHHHDAHHHHHHHDEVVSERGLRGLVGGGASQVSVSAAMRARDAARPTDDDLAAAERDLQIIRRGWVPREELTRPGRRSPTS
ncbi:hypothetical protein [Dactylosporangium sp. NPDC048998]|uniref:hypothetical protein n=1 Tax=Dactylosporangium sp. NPDC048998 TaxID=3363976 RepID=UPI0037196D86